MEEKYAKKRRKAESSVVTAALKPARKDTVEFSEKSGDQPTDGRNVGTEEGLTRLKDVCRQIRVGDSGFLKQKEFKLVCQFIGLGSVKKKEIVKLFQRMDTNKDGLISLSEVVSGLPPSTALHSPTPVPELRASRRSPTRSRNFSSLSRKEEGRNGPSLHNSTTAHGGTSWLFSSVKHNQDGYARSEDLIDLWDSIGVTNGADILLSLGLNPHGKINLSELMSALNEALTSPDTPEIVLSVAFISNLHELKYLKSLIVESMEENKKLRLDLSEANARNALLAHEVDDRHTQLDKSWESRLLDTLGNIKETYWALDKKYQEQIKTLKSELNTARETGAAEVSKLKVQLQEAQRESAEDEQHLVDQLASSQQEISNHEKALGEASAKLFLLKKKNENLKKDLQHKLQLLQTPDNYKLEMIQQQEILARTQAENKKLRDENDELMAELEKTRQKLHVVKKRAGTVTSRLSESSTEISDSEEDISISEHSARIFRLQNPGKQQKLTAGMQPLEAEYNRHPSLSEELSQCVTEELIEQKLKDIEQRYRMAVTALEDKCGAEMKRMLDSFELVKTRLMSEQKAKQETLLAEQLKDLQTAFAQEKYDLVQKFESDINMMNIQHEQALQKGLLEAESYMQDNIKGAESLTGKLKDDFLSLVQEHTEIEVRQSQAAILNQLHKDRADMIAAFEQEKVNFYEHVGNDRKVLREQYEMQILALQTELNWVRSQLEAEKQMLSEISLKNIEESSALHNALEKLRRKMEGELLIKLARIKESFESARREIEADKANLEDDLEETQKLLVTERKKTTEINTLKETIQILRAKEKEMEKTFVEMKEKLFQEYQQIHVERSETKMRLKAAKEEGESQGMMDGLAQGREEGIKQGRMEGNEESFKNGKHEGYEAGYIQGKKDMNTESSIALEDMQVLVDSLKQKNTILDSELQQEQEKSNKYVQQLHDVKTSFDILLGGKDALESKFKESFAALVAEHQVETEHLRKQIQHLETQKLNLQLDKTVIKSQIEAVHQELQFVKQAMNQEVTVTESESHTIFPEDHGSIQKQRPLLSYQLKETLKTQHELDIVKKDYEALLQEKSELETTVEMLKCKTFDDEFTSSKSHLEQIKKLSDDKQKMQALLDQTSDQLVKASTSMALAQSKFVRELESMKHKAKSMVEVESYTKLQISLVEHQRLVITLQDTQRERESMVDRFIKETEAERWHATQMMEAKVKDIQIKLGYTQKELSKYKAKYKEMCVKSNRRNLILKDLYVENSVLMKTLADSEEKRRCSEHLQRQLNGKCEAYSRTIDRVFDSLSK